MDTDAFCREIEAHLCRRNAGHLVRLVGPAFEMVAGWAAQGVPLKVALRGIDACVDRRASKGPSRRPIRVEFCEADVLDAFDQWRRAVGVGTASGAAVPPAGDVPTADPQEEPKSRPGHSLRAHLDRVVTRLTDRVVAGSLPGELEAVLESVLEGLASARESSRTLRGAARTQLIERLREVDDQLVAAATAATPPERLAALSREADQDLRAFTDRMPPEAYARALAAATAKLVREHWKLPEIGYEM